MAILKSRIMDAYAKMVNEYLEPIVKRNTAEQLGKEIDDLEDEDWKPFLNEMVTVNASFNEFLVESIISEIKENAEFEIPSADVGLDKKTVKVVIPVLTVTVGTVLNPLPIPLSGEVVDGTVSGKVEKGNIK